MQTDAEDDDRQKMITLIHNNTQTEPEMVMEEQPQRHRPYPKPDRPVESRN